MIDKKLVEEYMKKLDISEDEAIQLIQDDMEDYIGEEGEKLQEKAKEVKRYEKSTTKTERKPREKKIDEDKKKIIEIIAKALTDNGYNAIITNVDKAIDFDCYTVNLVKHRKAKDK